MRNVFSIEDLECFGEHKGNEKCDLCMQEPACIQERIFQTQESFDGCRYRKYGGMGVWICWLSGQACNDEILVPNCADNPKSKM